MGARYFVLFSIVITILSGCWQQPMEQEVLSESQTEIVKVQIPTEIAQQFGSLNIEQKVKNVNKVVHASGAITIELGQEQLKQISNETEQLFLNYLEHFTEKKSNGFQEVTMNNDFSEWYFVISNENILATEGFELAEELLVKNALTYQLVNRQIPTVIVRYYSDEKKLLDEKMIQTKFIYSEK